MALVLGTAACPGERSDSPSLPPERPPPAGTLRLGYPEEPPSLNPVTDSSPASRDILRAVLPSFFVVTPDLEYRPYLLAGQPQVTRTPDRMTVRFRIRDDAVWSDGRPITVQDVSFTWRVMTDPGLEVARPDGFDHLVEVIEDSSKAGRLVLSPPLASWRDLFSAGRFVLPAHLGGPAEVGEWNRGPPVGAGPFSLDRWVAGRSVILSANQRFFGPRPLVRRIEVAFVPDPTTAIQLLRAGLLDAVAPMLGLSWSRRLAAIPGVEVSESYGADLVHLVMNTETLDVGVRRGIASSIDRSRFVEGAVRDEGRLADGVLAPEQPGAVPAWSHYGTRTAEEVRPIEELSLAYTRTELLDFLAGYLQVELRLAGVDVELVPLDSDVFQEIFFPEHRFDLALWESRTGPAPALSRWVEVRGAGEPVTGLGSERLAELNAGVESGTGADLRAAQQLLAALLPVLPIFQPSLAAAWRTGVEGIEVNPTVDGPLWNTWEWSKAG